MGSYAAYKSDTDESNINYWKDRAENAEAKLERVEDIKFKTHPSWGCSKEFSDGWKACREQVQESIDE